MHALPGDQRLRRGHDRRVLVIVLITKFTARRLDRVVAMAVLFADDAGDPPALRPGRAPSCAAEPTSEPMLPARNHADRAGLQAAQADPAGPRLRPGHPAGHARRRSPSTSTTTDDRGAAGRSGSGAGIPVPLTVLDSPYREITRPVLDYVKRLRRRVAARRGHRLHPRVRRRPLVGAPAAQPERAAAQGPAAVRAGRDGDQRALAARVLRPAQGPARAGRAGRRAPRAGRPASDVRHDSRASTARTADAVGRRLAIELDGRTGRPRRLCVARHDGRVVFVRHALPGERVARRVTEDDDALPAGRRGRGPRAPRRTG